MYSRLNSLENVWEVRSHILRVYQRSYLIKSEDCNANHSRPLTWDEWFETNFGKIHHRLKGLSAGLTSLA